MQIYYADDDGDDDDNDDQRRRTTTTMMITIILTLGFISVTMMMITITITLGFISVNIAAEDPCSVATDSVCDPCYKCANAPATYVECRYGCNMDYQRCTILDNTGPIAHYSCKYVRWNAT